CGSSFNASASRSRERCARRERIVTVANAEAANATKTISRQDHPDGYKLKKFVLIASKAARAAPTLTSNLCHFSKWCQRRSRRSMEARRPSVTAVPVSQECTPDVPGREAVAPLKRRRECDRAIDDRRAHGEASRNGLRDESGRSFLPGFIP